MTIKAPKPRLEKTNTAVFSRAVFQMQESGRFLKKAAQKFLLHWAMGVVTDHAHSPN
ncbi:MAG TPA: hypothetical protein VGG47_08635 [Acidocella sp.]